MKNKRNSIIGMFIFAALAARADNDAVLANFDFSSGLANCTNVTGVSSAILAPVDYQGSTKDTDPSDGTIDMDSFLVADGAIYLKRGSRNWGFDELEGPFTVTLTATPEYNVLVESLQVDWLAAKSGFKSQQLAVQFSEQAEPGILPGSSAMLNTKSSSVIIKLNKPVLIIAGSARTFIIDLNSGVKDSVHVLDALTVRGSALKSAAAGEPSPAH